MVWLPPREMGKVEKVRYLMTLIRLQISLSHSFIIIFMMLYWDYHKPIDMWAFTDWFVGPVGSSRFKTDRASLAQVMDVLRKFDKPVPEQWRDYEARQVWPWCSVSHMSAGPSRQDLFQNQTRANCRGWAWFTHVQTSPMVSHDLLGHFVGHVKTTGSSESWHHM